MRTLSRKITHEWFPDAAAFNAVKLAWKEALKTDDLRPEHHMLYAMIRGKDYTRGFPLPTNQTKLDNGYRAERKASFYRIVGKHVNYQPQPNRNLRIASASYPGLLLPFKGTITQEMLEKLREFLPTDPSPKKDPYRTGYPRGTKSTTHHVLQS